MNPLRYTEIVTSKRVKRALAIAWFSPFASVCIVPLAYSDEQVPSFSQGLIGCLNSRNSSNEPPLSQVVHTALNVVGFGMIPSLVVLFVYGRIARVPWHQSSRTEPGTHLNLEHERRHRKEIKWMTTTSKFA